MVETNLTEQTAASRALPAIFAAGLLSAQAL